MISYVHIPEVSFMKLNVSQPLEGLLSPLEFFRYFACTLSVQINTKIVLGETGESERLRVKKYKKKKLSFSESCLYFLMIPIDTRGIRKVSIPSAENGIKVNTLQNYRDILFLSFCTHCENLKGTGSI